eukprot:m51a1_g14327 hypothetical protein (387) ;mRNA; f:88533-90482
MRFVVDQSAAETAETGAGPRTGRLAFEGRDEAATPCAAVATRKGHVPYVTPDLFRHLPLASLLQLHVSDLVEDREALKACAPQGDAVRAFYKASPSRPFYVTARDAATFFDQPINAKRMTLPTRHGNAQVTAAEYVEMAAHAGAEMVESLNPDVAPTDSLARHKKCSGAGLKWLDECVAAAKGRDLNILGVVQGGPWADMRVWYAAEVAKRPVAGFVLGGFGYGEPTAQRNELVKATIDALPRDKLRVIPGVGTPEDVLDMVALGVDIVQSNYPNEITELGCALSFPLDPIAAQPRESASADPHKINLRDTVYALDKGPLVEGCACFACRNHTRGYVHHLMNTHEMLAEILLSLHNHHHYTAFFAAIRASVAEGRFAEYRSAFLAL